MWFQWQPSVLVAPVVFQYVLIMQINPGLPMKDNWVIALASVVPMQSVQWHSSVPRASGLGVIRSDHFPACNPLSIQLEWRESFELSWFHLYYNPKYTKTRMVLIYKACTDSCWSAHTFEEQKWCALGSSELQEKAGFTETCPVAACGPVTLSFQTGIGSVCECCNPISGVQCRLQ